MNTELNFVELIINFLNANKIDNDSQMHIMLKGGRYIPWCRFSWMSDTSIGVNDYVTHRAFKYSEIKKIYLPKGPVGTPSAEIELLD